jgi:hypothetical protein
LTTEADCRGFEEGYKHALRYNEGRLKAGFAARRTPSLISIENQTSRPSGLR